ncbi:hypothetical protein D9M72_606940 [compost metagenome]
MRLPLRDQLQFAMKRYFFCLEFEAGLHVHPKLRRAPRLPSLVGGLEPFKGNERHLSAPTKTSEASNATSKRFVACPILAATLTVSPSAGGCGNDLAVSHGTFIGAAKITFVASEPEAT